jgi:hypothetical protein
MIEVFKTNVIEVDVSKQIIQKLLEHFPNGKINFDLDDSDKILRIETAFFENENVNSILKSMGYQCEVLPDK